MSFIDHETGRSSPGGLFVCARCLDDDSLKAWVRKHAESPTCSFCHRHNSKRLIAADADELAEFMSLCISVEYEDASQMVAWDEGEYVARTMTTEELLQDEIGLEPINKDAFSYLVSRLPDNAWVDVDYYSQHPRDILVNGWRHFAQMVMHETRYLFFPPPDDDAFPQHDEIRPEAMLDAMGDVIRAHRLVRTIRPGTRLYRVRAHGRAVHPTMLNELASPPPDAVRSANRMSPAGISMLYAASDAATALDEARTAVREQGAGTLATFEVAEPIRVVDFVRLPLRPEFFSTGYTRDERGRIQFLHAFAREISKPLAKRSVDQIEYVPTQVITEYLRFRFRAGRRSVEGIRYNSAQRETGSNIALFLGHDAFTRTDGSRSSRGAPLKLVSYRRITSRTRR